MAACVFVFIVYCVCAVCSQTSRESEHQGQHSACGQAGPHTAAGRGAVCSVAAVSKPGLFSLLSIVLIVCCSCVVDCCACAGVVAASLGFNDRTVSHDHDAALASGEVNDSERHVIVNG